MLISSSNGTIAMCKAHASKVMEYCAREASQIFGGNAYVEKADVDAFEALRDVTKMWSKRMLATHTAVYGDDLQPMWSSCIDAWTSIYHERGGDVCMKEAKSIACPTLVLHGAKDVVCIAGHAEWFASNIADAQLRVLPDGKHNLHLRYADEVNAMIKAFVAGEKVPDAPPPAAKL